MFGVVPKSIWNKLNPADANNMCSWALRCLLIEDGKRLILIDNGVGNKQDAKFFSYYYLHGDDTLEKSLNKLGFKADDITDMFLTHLHFDHCGGSIRWNSDHTGYELAFKNAVYWSNSRHWDWAVNPNAREKASFLKENILPIKESGQLQMIPDPPTGGSLALQTASPLTGMDILFVNGHTDAMMLPKIKYKGRTLVYMADLIPSSGHVPIPYVMAYDMFPLTTINEKQAFLKEAAENDYILFFEHDRETECCSLQQTEKGVRIKERFKLAEL